MHTEVYVLRIGFMHVYYSMYFYYHLLFVIYVLSLDKAWESAHVSQPVCYALHLSWTLIYMLDCKCLDWEVASQLVNYCRHNLIYWLYQNRQFLQDLITRHQMGLST